MYRPGPEVQVTFEVRMLNANEQTRKAVEASRAKLVGDTVKTSPTARGIPQSEKMRSKTSPPSHVLSGSIWKQAF